MARGPKRIGLPPDDLKEACKALQAAHDWLSKVTAAYPIKFDPAEPYGASNNALNAIDAAGEALTGDAELFSNQRLNPEPPFHRR